jgi:TonB family protein
MKRISTLIACLIACLLICSGVGRASSNNVCKGNASDSPECITPPIPTHYPEPKYPDNEINTGHDGDVILHVVIGTDGVAHDISVARSLSPDFDAAAIAAVQTWTFTPAKRNGKPMPVLIAIKVVFHVRR